MPRVVRIFGLVWLAKYPEGERKLELGLEGGMKKRRSDAPPLYPARAALRFCGVQPFQSYPNAVFLHTNVELPGV